MTILHEALCVIMFYGAFCRLVRCNNSTKVEIRVAFFLIGAAACAGLTQPLRAHWEPSLFELLLLVGVVTMQMVTAPRWRDGVPAKFQTGGHP